MVLARLDAARYALMEARTVDDVLELRDQAAAMQQYLKRRDYSLECQNDAVEIKVRAERKLGELTKEMEKAKGTVLGGNIMLPPDNTPTYASLGLNKMAVSRWQEASSLPEEVFEQHVAATRKRGDLLTSEGVRRRAKDLARDAARQSNANLTKATAPVAEHLKKQETQTFQTVVIDPPWDWGDEGDVSQMGRGNPIYQTQSYQDILALPIADISNANAHLYLWITNRSLPKGFALMEAWGFRYITCLTWVKPSFGMGNYFRGSTEHVLFGVKGSLPLLRKDVGTSFTANRGDQHSAKPDAFYEIVEQCSPGPWLDMYARKQRAGWTVWGAES